MSHLLTSTFFLLCFVTDVCICKQYETWLHFLFYYLLFFYHRGRDRDVRDVISEKELGSGLNEPAFLA